MRQAATTSGDKTTEQVLLRSAREYRENGRLQEALTTYRRLCATDTIDPQIWLERSDAALQLRRHDEAADALYMAAKLYAYAGDPERAATISRQVLRLAPAHEGAAIFVSERERARRAPKTGRRKQSIDRELMDWLAGAPGRRDPMGKYAPPDEWAEGTRRVAGREVAQAPQTAETEVTVAAQVVVGDCLPIERRVDCDAVGDWTMVHAVASALESSPLVADLDASTVRALIDSGLLINIGAERPVFLQGDPGDSLFVVLQGQLAVERETDGVVTRLATMHEGAFFGEIALITGAPRSATVRALTDVTLLEVSKDAIDAVLESRAQVFETLMKFFRARLVGTIMATSPLFRELSVAERQTVISKFLIAELPQGHRVIEQGKAASGLYIVLAGRLRVSRGSQWGTEILGTLSTGEVFGEMSLLNGADSMATVAAEDRCWLLRLPCDEFTRLATGYPILLDRLTEIAKRRERDNRCR